MNPNDEYDLNNIPEPTSPIDEMLSEFAKELPIKDLPIFGPNFYNRLFAIYHQRKILPLPVKPITKIKLVYKKTRYNLRLVIKKK
jgi:hypothetical protein